MCSCFSLFRQPPVGKSCVLLLEDTTGEQQADQAEATQTLLSKSPFICRLRSSRASEQQAACLTEIFCQQEASLG